MSTARDLRPTWAEIDREAFSRNVDSIAKRLPRGSQLIAVLKGDAYGHGAVELAKLCTPDRVAMIATALLEESLELRRAGIELPLLVLGPLTETQIRIALDQRITMGVVGPEELELVCRVARDRDVAIHLKLDTGMGRMGVTESELPRVVEMEHGRFGAIPSSHLGGIGLDLVAAISAPDDQPDLVRGGGAERHRWAGLGFHI